MRAALDTNILAYAEGFDEVAKRDVAVDLLRRLSSDMVVLPAQVMGELFQVLVRKGRLTPAVARERLLHWSDAFPVVGTSAKAVQSAFDLSADHLIGIWDAVILSVSAEADCRLLLSEDMQDGFTWRGVTVVNPFSSRPHPLLAEIVDPKA